MQKVSANTVSQLDPLALDLLFIEARTHTVWQDRDVETSVLEHLYRLMKMAPTSMNISPARIVFIKSSEAKRAAAASACFWKCRKDYDCPCLRNHWI